MEKQDAAMDRRLPAFICATMSSRSVLLMLLINSTYLKQPPQAVSRQATKPLYTLREGFHISFAYWLSGSFVEKRARLFVMRTLHERKVTKNIPKKQAIPIFILNKVKKVFFYVILVSKRHLYLSFSFHLVHEMVSIFKKTFGHVRLNITNMNRFKPISCGNIKNNTPFR